MAYVHVEKNHVENISIRYDELNKPFKKSKPAAHLEQNILPLFRLEDFVPSNPRTRKNIEAFFIAIMRPSLNEQNHVNCFLKAGHV